MNKVLFIDEATRVLFQSKGKDEVRAEIRETLGFTAESVTA